nr:PREDICTED: general odorant-binding protein 71 [Megachile rotundata]XP_012145126.1 PREDICTED: general odorant-binding protein 71 [Megachile rotundata]
MKHFEPLILTWIILFFFHEGTSLKCRSGNQEVDVQFQKVLTTCRKRYADSNTDNSEDSTSTENNSSESDSNSDENIYEKNFFDKKGDQSYNQSTNTQRYRNSNRNSNINTSDRSINRNIKHFHNIRHIRRSNDQDSWNSRNVQNNRSNFHNREMNNGSMKSNNNTDREQACVVQCFFNELNVVDQKGFPERDLVIPLMTQNIQDPELKDFVEESIIECFHYLESNKREKCEFSQNLLTCLAEKGQQRCEDWEN